MLGLSLMRGKCFEIHRMKVYFLLISIATPCFDQKETGTNFASSLFAFERFKPFKDCRRRRFVVVEEFTRFERKRKKQNYESNEN